MKPFDMYPGKGYKLLGVLSDSNCRHGYCLKLQQLTHQKACAYCGLNLIEKYEQWLMMSIDHVIPIKAGKVRGISQYWLYDVTNSVLCCLACNGFGNRYKLPKDVSTPKSETEFFNLRDKVFKERSLLIKKYQKEERKFYKSRPWEQK